jgi:hypothetical protein
MFKDFAYAVILRKKPSLMKRCNENAQRHRQPEGDC